MTFEITKDRNNSEVDIALSMGGGEEEGTRCGLPGKRKLVKALEVEYAKLNNDNNKRVVKGVGGAGIVKIAPIYEPSKEQQQCAGRIASVIRSHVAKISTAGLDGEDEEVMDMLLGGFGGEDKEEGGFSPTKRSSDERAAISARVRVGEAKNANTFLQKHKATQMFHSFKEEETIRREDKENVRGGGKGGG